MHDPPERSQAGRRLVWDEEIAGATPAASTATRYVDVTHLVKRAGRDPVKAGATALAQLRCAGSSISLYFASLAQFDAIPFRSFIVWTLLIWEEGRP